MLIREIMTENVEFVTPDESLQEAALKMRDFGVGPLPVCENQAVVGMLTDRDITIRAVAEGRGPESTKVRDVMSSELICCFDDQEVDVAARTDEVAADSPNCGFGSRQTAGWNCVAGRPGG